MYKIIYRDFEQKKELYIFKELCHVLRFLNCGYYTVLILVSVWSGYKKYVLYVPIFNET